MTVKSKIPANITDNQLLISMTNRRGGKLRQRSQAYQNSSEATSESSSEIQGVTGKSHANLSETINTGKVEIPLEDPDTPSTDLRRKPRGIIRWFKYLPSRVRNYWKMIRPPLTLDEIERKMVLEKEKHRDWLCKKESRKYRRIISEKLSQLGEREVTGNNTPDRPRKTKKVRWTVSTRDELFTKIIIRMDTDPRHLPSYVVVSNLARKEYYSDEMLPTLAHYMEFRSHEAGVFAIIFREGLEGIPDTVTAAEIWNKIPENKPPLTIPVGYGDNSTRKDLDLDDCPHLIVAGATGQGKSNFINNIICFWLRRGLTKYDLQLILFDLKRGMEFTYYTGLPHLYHDDPEDVRVEKEKKLLDPDVYNPIFIESGIIEELRDVMPALRRVRQIMDGRLDHIKMAGYKDFNAFNQSKHSKQKRLPAIVVVWDEWARARLSLGTEPENLLAEITNLARAAGIYFILGTQNPNSSVISPLIGVNFSSRIVFKCSLGGSMAALGNQSAKDLEEKGRGILQHHGNQWKLQTPLIPDGLIQAVVYKAITGKDKAFTNSVDFEEILKYSLDNMDGILEFNKLFEIFRAKKVTKHWLTRAFKEADNHDFDLSGTRYKVCPRGRYVPRHLERVDP